MNNTTVAFIVLLSSVYATKEYAYNIHSEINCISKNKISTEEACERWRRNMKKFSRDHIFCKEIWNKDGIENRACSPEFLVQNDVITKLSYRWCTSDTARPITIEVEYTGLSYSEQRFVSMLIVTCLILLISCFCINDCNDSSTNNNDFISGFIIGNMHDNSHSSWDNSWDNSNSYGGGFSLAAKDD